MTDLVRRPNARIWLAIVGAATLIIGLSYTLAQQVTRLSANDAPRNLADITRSYAERPNADNIVPSYTTELTKDDSVFVIITNKDGKLVLSNALLGGNPNLVPPKGILTVAASKGYDAVTWQPANGVRLATYTEPYKNGFITAGQNLKPYEDRITLYTVAAFTAWIATVGWACLTLWYWKDPR